MSAIHELGKFVQNATETFRKGPEVEQRGGATHVYAMSPASEVRTVNVDVHFVVIGFTEAAAGKADFIRLISDSEQGEFGAMPLDRLVQGPSFIELGGWLGSQDLALRFMALGQHYGLWTVITPATLGIEGAVADQMAGGGMVMIGPSAETRALLDPSRVA